MKQSPYYLALFRLDKIVLFLLSLSFSFFFISVLLSIYSKKEILLFLNSNIYIYAIFSFLKCFCKNKKMGQGCCASYGSDGGNAAKTKCFCSSENWKSYQMDLNTAVIIDESDGTKPSTEDVEVVTLHFKCSSCENEFKDGLYYHKEICRKNGRFRQTKTVNDPIPLELPYDSLKPILDKLKEAEKVYDSKTYVIDLIDALFEENCFANENTCSCSSKYWKSYQIDLNTVKTSIPNVGKKLLDSTENDIDEQPEPIDCMIDLDVVNIHFKCSECEKEFKMVCYYSEGFYSKFGQFRRIITSTDPIPLKTTYDSLKFILDELADVSKTYASNEYAVDLFRALEEDETLVF